MKRKEFDLHSEIAELLKKNKIIDESSTWGSCGPDIYIKGKSVIEIKPKESEAKIKEAYKQMYRERGVETF